jgi:hypothetical protein
MPPQCIRRRLLWRFLEVKTNFSTVTVLLGKVEFQKRLKSMSLHLCAQPSKIALETVIRRNGLWIFSLAAPPKRK